MSANQMREGRLRWNENEHAARKTLHGCHQQSSNPIKQNVP
jgi:hypothetical protein